MRRRLVTVVAFDGVVLGDLAIPCEVFGRVRDAAGRPLYEVRVCSAETVVRSEHVALEVPWRLSSLGKADTVIVPGLEDIDREVPASVLRAIGGAARRGARVASICSGAFVLATGGILDGLDATTHWLGAPELARRHPAIRVNPDVLYVDNGQVLTSAGAAAGFDLCIHMVRRDFGAAVAMTAARAAVMPLERWGGQAQFVAQEPAVDEASSMHSLLAWLDKNLHRDLDLPAVAYHAAMSTRTLSRRFRAQMGISPAQWIARARVRRAQRLLETTARSVERIADDVGFGSATVLRQNFGEVVGTSPQAYRRAFPGPRSTA